MQPGELTRLKDGHRAIVADLRSQVAALKEKVINLALHNVELMEALIEEQQPHDVD